MCFSSNEISLPKFLPTTHYHVGKKSWSNCFLSSLARSTSWNLEDFWAFYITNSIAFRRISKWKLAKLEGTIWKSLKLTFLEVALFDANAFVSHDCLLSQIKLFKLLIGPTFRLFVKTQLSLQSFAGLLISLTIKEKRNWNNGACCWNIAPNGGWSRWDQAHWKW